MKNSYSFLIALTFLVVTGCADPDTFSSNERQFQDRVGNEQVDKGDGTGGFAEGGFAEGGAVEGGFAEGGAVDGGFAEGGFAEGGAVEGDITEDDLESDPVAPPEPTVSFSEVQSIFNASCTGCHGRPGFFGPSGGLSLADGYSYDAIVNVPSRQLSSMYQIAPGAPEDSYLWLKIVNQFRERGGRGGAMPPWNELSQAELITIRTWILEGALRD